MGTKNGCMYNVFRIRTGFLLLQLERLFTFGQLYQQHILVPENAQVRLLLIWGDGLTIIMQTPNFTHSLHVQYEKGYSFFTLAEQHLTCQKKPEG